MKSRLLLAAILLAPFSAAAQTPGGPPIAYMKVEGSAAGIYLASDDGSAPVKLFATKSKRTIAALDLRPGGGEIAFIEFGSGVPRTLKLLSFNDSGVPTGPARTISGLCAVVTVDYHPTEPLLIISEVCGGVPRIATVGTDGSGHSVLVTGGAYLNKARWLKDGQSYVYVRDPGTAQLQLCRNACDPGSNDLLWTGSGMSWMDVGRQTNSILFDSGGTFIHRLNADTGDLQTNFISGTDGHFSPNDGDVLYETPHSARGDYLFILRSDGGAFRLTGKGEYGPKDWRN